MDDKTTEKPTKKKFVTGSNGDAERIAALEKVLKQRDANAEEVAGEVTKLEAELKQATERASTWEERSRLYQEQLAAARNECEALRGVQDEARVTLDELRKKVDAQRGSLEHSDLVRADLHLKNRNHEKYIEKLNTELAETKAQLLVLSNRTLPDEEWRGSAKEFVLSYNRREFTDEHDVIVLAKKP